MEEKEYIESQQEEQVQEPEQREDPVFDSEGDPEEEEKETDNPFNPDDISIDTRVFTLDNIVNKMVDGTMNLNPDFQRNEVWTVVKKSQLIESIMLKIPIPMFYVSSDTQENLSVVDGVQRLSTLRDFVLGKEYMASIDEDNPDGDLNLRGKGMKLKHMEFWTSYEGKTFKELPPMLKNRIRDTNFQFTIINPGTPEEVKRNIFKRINTGGDPLTSQEIRNAIYTGRATQLLNYLAQDNAFKEATCHSIKGKRMEDKELILRMVSFMVRSYKNFNRTVTADTWLGDTMIILNAMPGMDSKEYKKLLKGKFANDVQNVIVMSDDEIAHFFHRAMERCKIIFGRHAFRKSSGNQRLAPINRCLFEMWGTIIGGLSSDEFTTLMSRCNEFMDDYDAALSDPEFQIAITRDSLKHISLKKRFNALIDITYKYVKN